MPFQGYHERPLSTLPLMVIGCCLWADRSDTRLADFAEHSFREGFVEAMGPPAIELTDFTSLPWT